MSLSKQAVDTFLAREGRTAKTIASYTRCLHLFGDHIGKDRRVGSLTKRDVESWLHAMNCKPVSKQTYLRTLRAAVRCAVQAGWLKLDVTSGVTVGGKIVQQVRPWLDYTEWEAFLAALDRYQRVRFGFVLETGLRRDEMLQARHDWIHTIIGRPAIRIAPDSNTGFVPKWGQSRAVALSAKAQDYLEVAKVLWPGRTYIFQDDDRPLRDPCWARDIGRACERAGVTKTDMHGLRRSAGARWIHDGMQLHIISRLLGHRDISTTMRWYGGIADGTIAAAMAAIDARTADRDNVVPIKRKALQVVGGDGGTGDTK